MVWRRLRPRAAAAIPACVFVLSLGPAAALSRSSRGGRSGLATVRGRVVERGSSRGIVGADVALSGLPAVITDDSGAFRIARVPAGRYTLSVSAPGYRAAERVLIVMGDTVLTIALAPAPFALDTLRVQARRVTVRGEVVDAETGRELVDVSVVVGDRQTLTNPAGGFKLSHIPEGVPLPMSLSDFGYLPLDTTIDAGRGTKLRLALAPDPVARRMVAAQVARLQHRAKPFHSVLMRTLGRQALVDQDGGSALDVVKQSYGVFLDHLYCVLINNMQTRSVPAGLDRLRFLVPAELQRVEVLKVQGHDQLRVYTRDYMRTMVSGQVHLRPPMAAFGICY